MSEQQRIEAVRDYLRGLGYQGGRVSKGQTATDFLAGLHMKGMAELLSDTDDADIASLMDAGRALGAARRAG